MKIKLTSYHIYFVDLYCIDWRVDFDVILIIIYNYILTVQPPSKLSKTTRVMLIAETNLYKIERVDD